MFDMRARGYTYGHKLVRTSTDDKTEPQSHFFPRWASTMVKFQWLNLPLVFVSAFHKIAETDTSDVASPVASAFRLYCSRLAPLLILDSMSSESLEKITFAHLAVRIAVAKAWASSRPVPVRVPVYHVLGTDLPLALDGIEFEATDLALPMPAPSAAVQNWTVAKPMKEVRLQGHDAPFELHTNPGSPPFLLLSAAQNSSFDVMMSLQPTVGRKIVVLIDCAFSSDSTNLVSDLSNFKNLQSKVKQLKEKEGNRFFEDAMLVPCLVTNRSATTASHTSYMTNDVLLVSNDELDSFFSPTLAPLVRSLCKALPQYDVAACCCSSAV